MISNVTPLGAAADVTQAIAGQLRFIHPAGVHDDKTGSYPRGGFARDFATADGERVRVEAFTRQQFADLGKTTRLARTFAFLERVLGADFCACGGLYTQGVIITALRAPWFARHTVAELAAASQEPRYSVYTFATSPARSCTSAGGSPDDPGTGARCGPRAAAQRGAPPGRHRVAAPGMLPGLAHAGVGDTSSATSRRGRSGRAQLMETHLTCLLLAFYRSQHVNQNWLAA